MDSNIHARECMHSEFAHTPVRTSHGYVYHREREREVLAHPQTDTHIHALVPTHTNASLCVCARVSHVAIYVVRSEEAAKELLGGGWFYTLKIEWMPGPLLWAAAIRMRGCMHRLLWLK